MHFTVELFICRFTILLLSIIYSPSQDVDDNSAAHHEWHQGASGLGVDSPQQHHHGDQARHGDLSKESAPYSVIWLQQSKRSPVGFGEVLSGGHRLLAIQPQFSSMYIDESLRWIF